MLNFIIIILLRIHTVHLICSLAHWGLSISTHRKHGSFQIVLIGAYKNEDINRKSTVNYPNQEISLVWKLCALHMEASRNLKRFRFTQGLKLLSRFVLIKLTKQAFLASNQNQEILLIDGFAPTVFWPRDIPSSNTKYCRVQIVSRSEISLHKVF